MQNTYEITLSLGFRRAGALESLTKLLYMNTATPNISDKTIPHAREALENATPEMRKCRDKINDELGLSCKQS